MKTYFQNLGNGALMFFLLVLVWLMEFLLAGILISILHNMGILEILGGRVKGEVAAMMASMAWIFTGLPFLGYHLIKDR